MKKLLSVFVLLSFVLSLSACGKKIEEFSIRNGVKFGMSFSELVEAEGGYGIFGDYYAANSGKTREEYHLGEDGNDTLVYYDVVFNQKAAVMYTFTDGTVAKMMISLDIFDTSYNEGKNTEIIELLNQKYGDNIGMISTVRNGNNGDFIIDHDTVWLINQKDGCVIITNKVITVDNKMAMHQIEYNKTNLSYKEIKKEYEMKADKY